LAQSELASLYGAHAASVALVCRRLLRDPCAAEDATHEVFLRVQRHLSRLPAAEEMRPWIYRIATNYCLNEIRDRKRRPAPADELPEGAGLQDPAAWLADRDLVARLIARAPARLRVVAWMIHVDGMSHDEVAEVLGVTRRTVGNHLALFSKNAHKFARRAA